MDWTGIADHPTHVGRFPNDFQHIDDVWSGVIVSYNTKRRYRSKIMDSFEKVLFDALYDVLDAVWQQASNDDTNNDLDQAA